MTRLKELPPAERLKLLELLRDKSYKDAQPLVEAMVGFVCTVDVLCRFFSWQMTQEDMELSKDMAGQVLGFVREHYPDWPEERLREVATAYLTMHTMAKRDVRGFACIARLGLQGGRNRLRAQRLEFDERRLAQSQRRKIDEGMEVLADAFKQKPEALKLYRQARQLIEQGETCSVIQDLTSNEKANVT